MRVRDFAAELISEIADELGYLVYKYECLMPSNGSIVFEKEVEDDKKEVEARRYKILTYDGHTVYLQAPVGIEIIDLHDPDSVDEIREWFENPEEAFDSPFGYSGITTIGPIGPQGVQGPIGTPYTITTSPHTQPTTWAGTGTGWSPNTGAWTGTQPCATFIGGGGTQTTQLITTNKAQNHLFSFNSFGSLALGP